MSLLELRTHLSGRQGAVTRHILVYTCILLPSGKNKNLTRLVTSSKMNDFVNI